MMDDELAEEEVTLITKEEEDRRYALEAARQDPALDECWDWNPGPPPLFGISNTATGT